MKSSRQFKTAFGFFDDGGKEFVVTTPRTPRPWVNVVSNGDAGFVISQTGGGYSWRGNAQVNRLTRWEQDILKDEWGKYIYLRDAETGKVWSASWKPVCAEPDFYEARYGAGYAVITSRNEGIETEWLLTIAPDEPVELWKLTIRNRTRKNRRLQVFTYFEWCLGAAPDWHREFHKCFTETSFDRSIGALVATKRLWEIPSENGHWNTEWPYVAFHSVNARVAAFEGSKENFLGNYGGVAMPEALKSGKLRNETGNQLDPIASLRVDVSLPPGKEKSLCFTLGALEDRARVAAMVKNYRSEESVDSALAAVKARWDALLGASAVDTPDAAMNIMLNRWLKYQAIAGRLWGRTGYYQAGGAYGFRDQLQDSQVFLAIDPEQTKQQILLHARHQFKDGTVYHWWHPLSEVGLPTQMTDDLLWLPFVTRAYIEETQDSRILDVREPYIDDPNGASLYDHCVCAIEKALTRMSPRGIPLIGEGDWNDGLSAAGLKWKGESVWLGEFLCGVLQGFSPIAALRGDATRAQEYSGRAEQLREVLNLHGWDGAWFYYGTKDSGEKFGSKENCEGTIHLIPQVWAVIADVASAERGHRVMDAVVDRLEHKAGTVLLSPAYRTPDEKIGYLTRYAPGTRENGATYTHAATWSVIAAAKLGRAEDAFRFFSKINPIVRGRKPQEYCAEPYVTPGNIDGPDSRFYGRGGWTWYSGSAAWLWKAGVEWILGVRAMDDGLVVSPCIPKQWKCYRVRRVFRGATYRVTVHNPSRVSTGIRRVHIEGKLLEGFAPSTQVVLPLCPPGTDCTVVVEMGPLS